MGGTKRLAEEVAQRLEDEAEILGWLDYDDGEWRGVRPGPAFRAPDGTPALPGLEKRLDGIRVSAYGKEWKVWSILQVMTEDEIVLSFVEVLEDMLQSGRGLPGGTAPCRR